MPSGSRSAGNAVIELATGVIYIDGQPVPVTKLRRTVVYSTIYRGRETEDHRIFAVTDPIVRDKDVVALAHQRAPGNPHLPAVRKIGAASGQLVYEMPYYTCPFRGVAEPVYKELRRLRRTRVCDVPLDRFRGFGDAFCDALHVLCDVATSISEHYWFDIYPRNLATAQDGALVLLDVVVDLSVRNEIYRKKGWDLGEDAHT